MAANRSITPSERPLKLVCEGPRLSVEIMSTGRSKSHVIVRCHDPSTRLLVDAVHIVEAQDRERILRSCRRNSEQRQENSWRTRPRSLWPSIGPVIRMGCKDPR